MEKSEGLFKDSITFGKYKGERLSKLLRDREYCSWLLDQLWFKESYEWLFNRIKEYNPKALFIKDGEYGEGHFIESYEYFNLPEPLSVQDELSAVELECYTFYKAEIEKLKAKILLGMENDDENPYNIKAPTNWLQEFERKTCIQRTDLKEFLASRELLNIPYIVERIKAEGGLTYNGAKSFCIAKERSEAQEAFWETILKRRYGEDLGSQFRYLNCIFDFLNISTNTIFECKLGLKDMNKDQHRKYLSALNKYRIIYLIGYDCVIDMQKHVIYTSNSNKYQDYFDKQKVVTPFDILFKTYKIVAVPEDEVETLFGL